MPVLLQAIRLVVPSDVIARLDGTEHLRHQYVAGSLIATSVGTDLVERSIPALAR
jgi:hypothetical protein